MPRHGRLMYGDDGEVIHFTYSGRKDQVPPACYCCNFFSDYLCDYPIGKGKTCDRNLCKKHRVAQDLGIDFCPDHARLNDYQSKDFSQLTKEELKEEQARWMEENKGLRPKVFNQTDTPISELTNCKYVGRGKWGHLEGVGPFGNPIRFSRKCPVCGGLHHKSTEGRKKLLQCYRKHLWKQIKEDEFFRADVRELLGMELLCHCAPLGCHADLLADASLWLWSPEGLVRFPLNRTQSPHSQEN